MLNREQMIDLENKLQGFQVRIKELHFSASSLDAHKTIDEFDEEFLEFEDSIMENMQALFDVIEPGTLNPILPEATTFKELLEDIRGVLVSVKKESEDNMMFTGVVNLIDDFFSTVNKYVYLEHFLG